MKKILSIILMLGFLLNFNTYAEEHTIRVLVNGGYVEFDTEPVIENDNLLVPIRKIAESFNATVLWNENEQQVTIDEKIKLKINEKNANINGVNYNLDVAPKIINNRTYVPIRFLGEGIGAEVKWDNVNKTAIIEYMQKSSDVQTFDLGKSKLTLTGNREVEYTINGSICVPETDNNPVVFLLHGSHFVEKPEETRYDIGFSYLLKELSKSGYLAISLNINEQFNFDKGEPVGYDNIIKIYEDNLEKLTEANKGGKSLYPVNLKNKANLENIILVGHSRGGQGIFSIADEQIKKGKNNIDGILAIAPSEVSPIEEVKIADVPISIIVPQYDGDVVNLDGQNFYDVITEIKERKSLANLIYLYGANHNYFNQAILKNDAENLEDVGKVLTPFEQQEFLEKYIVDFVNSVYKGDISQPNLNGYKALVSVYNPNDEKINLDNFEKSENVETNKVISSGFFKENTAGAFNPPGSRKKELLNVKWTKENSKITFKVPKTAEKNNSVSFTIAPNPTTKVNENQDFTIQLKDKNGKVQNFKTSLAYEEGKIKDIVIDENLTINIWSAFTPLSTVKINSENISEISLIFDQDKIGDIFIKDIFIGII